MVKCGWCIHSVCGGRCLPELFKIEKAKFDARTDQTIDLRSIMMDLMRMGQYDEAMGVHEDIVALAEQNAGYVETRYQCPFCKAYNIA